ncbi:Guanylate kinase [compost metagenome]
MNHKIVVLTGPSCGGKTSVQSALKDIYVPVLTATTRNPRQGELDGVTYHFKSKPQFEEEYASGKIVERVEYLGNHYGTPLSSIKEAIEGDSIRTVILEINGIKKLKELFGDKILVIYIGANIESLIRRFREERKASEEEVQERINKAVNEELQPHYISIGDFVVWNNDGVSFNDVLSQIKKIIA